MSDLILSREIAVPCSFPSSQMHVEMLNGLIAAAAQSTGLAPTPGARRNVTLITCRSCMCLLSTEKGLTVDRNLLLSALAQLQRGVLGCVGGHLHLFAR